jgi:hypothetical protein
MCSVFRGKELITCVSNSLGPKHPVRHMSGWNKPTPPGTLEFRSHPRKYLAKTETHFPIA